MKKSFILTALASLVIFTGLYANETFQAPAPDGGKSIEGNKAGTVNLLFEKLSFNEMADYYKKEIGNDAEIKWQDVENQNKIVIYDWGNREWHRIDITDNGDGKGVLVTVRKDNWTWIIGTLVIRFLGVFIVLIILMIALYISGKVLPMIKDKPEPKKA